MACHRIFNEVTGDGKQIRWTLTGFELIKSGGGKYVFKHPDNNVVITVKSISGVFQTMVDHELGVKLVFKEGKFERLDKDPTEPDEGAHRIILEKKEGS